MKTITHHILSALLVIPLLSACNSGNAGKDTLSSQASLKNGTDLFDSNLLGDKATYDSKVPEFNSTSCLNPDSFTYTFEKQKSHSETIIRTNSSSVFNSLLVDASVGGGYGLFKASATASYDDSTEVNSKGIIIDIISTQDGVLSMKPKSDFNSPDKIQGVLTESALGFWTSKNTVGLKNMCNNAYVRSIATGVKVIGRMEINFNSQEMKNKFSAGLDVSVGSFANISTSLTKFQKDNKTQSNIKVSTYTFGAVNPVFVPIGACSSESVTRCAESLELAVNNTIQSGNSLISSITANLKNGVTRDKALAEISSLYPTGDIVIERYPEAVLPSNITFNDEQKRYQESVIMTFSQIGALNNIINIAINNNLNADKAKTDLSTLNDIGAVFRNNLTRLSGSCFGWDIDQCKQIFDNDLKPERDKLNTLLSAYDGIMPKYGYYSLSQQLYFIPMTSNNKLTLYPIVLNKEFDYVAGDYYYTGANYSAKKQYIKPDKIAKFELVNGSLATYFTNSESELSGTCSKLSSNNYSCNLNSTSKLDPAIFKSLSYTTDTAVKSILNSTHKPIDNSTEHAGNFSSYLYLKRLPSENGNQWCDGLPNGGCISFDDAGHIVSKDGKTLMTFAGSAVGSAMLYIKDVEGDKKGKMTNLFINVNGSDYRLATIFTPTGDSGDNSGGSILRVYDNNLVVVPSKILNKLHQDGKSEENINDLIRQGQIPYTILSWSDMKLDTGYKNMVANVAYGSGWSDSELRTKSDLLRVISTDTMKANWKFNELLIYDHIPMKISGGYIMLDTASGKLIMYGNFGTTKFYEMYSDELKKSPRVVYQLDGNFVGYDSNNNAVWSSNTIMDGYRGSQIAFDWSNNSIYILDNNQNKLCNNNSCTTIVDRSSFIGDSGQIRATQFYCDHSNALRFAADNDSVRNKLLGVYIENTNKFYNTNDMHNVEFQNLCDDEWNHLKKVTVGLMYKDGYKKFFNVGTYTWRNYPNRKVTTSVGLTNGDNFSIDLSNAGDQDYSINGVDYHLGGGGYEKKPGDGKAGVFIYIK